MAQGIAPAEPLFDHLIGAQQERRRHIDIDCSDAKRPPRLLTRTDTSRLMLWFFLLMLVLGLVFGWHVAAVLLVLWLIGYVGFWLFMLCKPVKVASCSNANATRFQSWG